MKKHSPEERWGDLIRQEANMREITGSLFAQRQIEAFLRQHAVTPRFFFGSPLLEGFAIIHDQIPYVVINKNLSPEIQIHVAKRELAHIQLGHLDSLVVGYTGKYKQITGSSQVFIPRLGGDTFGLIETNVTVKRLGYDGQVVQTLTGKALVFASLRDTVNAGYVMVSQAQAPQWVQVLNGNPGYVFDSSRSNVYPYTITKAASGEEFIAYSLADLASASGGAGDPPPGDGLTKINDDLYLKRDGFKATPRPYGDISVAPAGSTTKSLVAPMTSIPATTSKVSPLSFAATSSNEIPPGLKPKYVDESGKHFADIDELLLVFGNFDGLGDKRFPMIFSKTSNKIFGVKKLDKSTATITVGDQIGEMVRREGNRVFFHLSIFPELEGKELSIEVK